MTIRRGVFRLGAVVANKTHRYLSVPILLNRGGSAVTIARSQSNPSALVVAVAALGIAVLLQLAGSATVWAATPTLTITTGSSPAEVAFDSTGDVFVAEGSHQVQKFDSTGRLLQTDSIPGVQFPFGVAVEPSGGVVVAEEQNPRVSKLDASGTVVSRFGIEGIGTGYTSGRFTSSTGIAVGPGGELFDLESTFGGAQVQHFGADGGYLSAQTLPATTVDPYTGQAVTLTGAAGLAVDGLGRAIVITSWSAGSGSTEQFRVLRFAGGGYAAVNPSGYCTARAVAVDSSNDVYVAGNTCVGEYDSSLGFIQKIGVGSIAQAVDVAVDGSGNVYVADAGNSMVEEFSASGTLLREFGGAGIGPGQFSNLAAVSVDSNSMIYAADGTMRIQEFDPNGNLVRSLGGPGEAEGKFGSVPYLAADGTSLFASDAHNDRIQKFDAQGTPILTTQFKSPSGIVRDAAGNFYIADKFLGNIQKVDSTGKFIARFGSNCDLSFGRGCVDPDGPGPLKEGDGQLDFPTHLAFDQAGNLLVLDYGNGRVVQYDAAGHFLANLVTRLSGPSGLAVDLAGNIYVADGEYEQLTLKRFTPTGVFDGSMYPSGDSLASQRRGIGGLAVDGAGRIYVTSGEQIYGTSSSLRVFSQWTPGNQPPTVSAGADVSGAKGAAIGLNGSVVDPEGEPVSIRWTYALGAGAPYTATCAFADAAAASTTITCTDAGVYKVTLTADDGSGPIVTDKALVLVTDPADMGKVCYDPVPNYAAAGWTRNGQGLVLQQAPFFDLDVSDISSADVITFDCNGVEMLRSDLSLTLNFDLSNVVAATTPIVYAQIDDGVRLARAALLRNALDFGYHLAFAIEGGGYLDTKLTFDSNSPIQFTLERNVDGTAILSVPGEGRESLPYDSLALSPGARGVIEFGTGTSPFTASRSTVHTFGLPKLPNRPPVANAGPDQTVDEGSPATVDGSASSDPDGDPLAFWWKQTGGRPVPVSASGSSLSFTPPDDGTYTFTLTVSDGKASSSDDVVVTARNVAPTATIVGPGPGALFKVGSPVTFTGTFTDPGILDTHTARWTFDSLTAPATVTEANGSGSANVTYTFSLAGVYQVSLGVVDNDGGVGNASTVGAVDAYVVVYDPTAGFVTGGGWINSPPGAYAADPSLAGRANFGFVSKYEKGATVPTGQTEFNFNVAGFHFHSDTYQWLVVAGAKAQYKGTGSVNGVGGYGFLLTATDGEVSGGGGVDKFRIKIWNVSTGALVYDNVFGAADDIDTANPQAIAGGDIVVHK